MEDETRQQADTAGGRTAGEARHDEQRANDPAFTTSLHVRRAREGSAESLAWIVEHLSPLIFANATYRLGARLRAHYDPEDLVNEVWLTALPKIAALPARDGRYTPVLLKFLSTTLFNKVSNLIQKHIQGKPKRYRGGAGDEASGGSATVDSLPDPVAGVITRIARREAEDMVLKSLDDLDPDAREIILLRGIEQHPYDELATVLGAAPKALSARYRRALEKLRARLPGSIYEELGDE